MNKRVMCCASLGMIVIGSSVGCGPTLRRDFLGRSGAVTASANAATDPATNPDGSMAAVTLAGPSAASAAPGTGAIMVHAGDELEIAWTITQPHAERLRYAIACAGAASDPIEVGETIEEYRVRRVAELRAARDRDRAVVSSVASAFVPNVVAGGQVQSGPTTGQVQVGVDRQAVGDTVAASVVTDDIVLAPGDVGAGALTGTLTMSAAADGPCAMTVFTDTPGVYGTISVTKVVDLGAEKRAREQARRSAALTVRGDLTASLYAAGARDRVVVLTPPEPAPVIEASVSTSVSTVRHPEPVDTSATVAVQVDTTYDDSLAIRGRYIAYLVGECHGDPNARQKQRDAEARRRQIAFELEQRRLRIALELRGHLRAQLVGFGADPEYRYKLRLAADARAEAEAARAHALAIAEDTAHHTRVAMVDFLVGLGARLRPPMPPPMPEDPGASPFSGAIWIAGQWIWSGIQWQWQGGGWRDDRQFGFDVAVGNDPRPSGDTVIVHDNRNPGPGPSTVVIGGGGVVSGGGGGGGGSTTTSGWNVHDNRNPGPSTVTIHPNRDPGGGDRNRDGTWVRPSRGGSRGGGSDGNDSTPSKKDKDKDKDKDDDKKPKNLDDERAGNAVRKR